MSKICPKCNTVLIDTAKFCKSCGTKVFVEEKKEVKKVFCSECGFENDSTCDFCMECGYNLHEEIIDDKSNVVEEIKEKDEWNNIKEDDEWNTNDSEDDKDEWKDLVNNFESIDETDKFIEFDYKKNSKGEITILKLKDEYAMEVVVPNGVTVIGNSAFEGSNALTISLPEGIKTIGKRAFANCSNLKELIVPKSVMMIGDEAFKDSKNLFVTIPNNVSFIGENIIKGTVNELKEIEKEKEEKKNKYKLGCDLLSNYKYSEAIPNLLIGQELGENEVYYKLGLCYEYTKNFNQMYLYYQKGADNNCSNSLYKLGELYSKGIFVEKNIDKAITYYDKAAQNNHYYATSNLANLYYEGKLVEKNIKKALYYFDKIITSENKSNIYYQKLIDIGKMYKNGVVIEKDLHKAALYLGEASKQGYIDATYHYALVCMESRNYIPAVLSFEKCAKFDDYKALYYCGYIKLVYLNDKTGEKKLVEAAEKTKSAEVMYLCGYALRRYKPGNKTSITRLEKSRLILEKAGEKGYKDAYWELYLMYISDTNQDKKIEYIKKAAELGHVDAMYTYGWYSLRGLRNVTKNEGLGLNYLEKAAEKGNYSAIYELFKYYYYDISNYEKSFYWISKKYDLDVNQKSVSKNNAQYTTYDLADHYLNGRGTEKNVQKGIELLEFSLECGSYYAAHKLGDIYSLGFYNVGKNLYKGLEYYKISLNKSIKNGNPKQRKITEDAIARVEKELNKNV